MNGIIFVATTSGNIKHGEIAGSATASQLPDIPCYYAVLKATSTNAGTVHIGSASTVTADDGTTDTTTGYPLNAGEEMQVFISNLNLLYRICDNAGDDISYICYV